MTATAFLSHYLEGKSFFAYYRYFCHHIWTYLRKFLQCRCDSSFKKRILSLPAFPLCQLQSPITSTRFSPVFSYIFLKGKCRYCNSPISPLYPLGELLTAVSIFFVYKNVGLSLELIPALLLTITLVISVLTDIREQLILDIVTLPMLGLLIFSRLFIGTNLFGTFF